MESGNNMTHLNRHLQDSVLIIDPQWVCRSGLKHLMLEQAGYQQVQEAESIEVACAKLSRFPNIKLIIMELRLPGMGYTESLAAVGKMANEIPILGMSDGLDRQEILESISHGAAGFVCKTGSEEEILQAIKAVESGAIHISKPLVWGSGGTVKKHQPSLQHRDKTHGQDPGRSQIRKDAMATLTVRQREVLEELGQGQSNRDIAEHMEISVNTVKLHVGAILKTLDIKNRTQAALLVQPH